MRYVLASVVLMMLGACASPQRTAVNFAVHHIRNAAREDIFAAAEGVLLEHGYRIGQRDPVAGVLTTQPRFDVPGDEPVRRGLGMSSKGRTRRIAEVRIEPAAQMVDVFCKVVVQEQTTRAHRFLARDQLGSDVPSDTPIEGEAATTTKQNTVWETIRRDKAGERRILTAIAERTSPAAN